MKLIIVILTFCVLLVTSETGFGRRVEVNNGYGNGNRAVRDGSDLEPTKKSELSKKTCTALGYTDYRDFGSCTVYCYGNRVPNFENVQDGTPCEFGEGKCQGGKCKNEKQNQRIQQLFLKGFQDVVNRIISVTIPDYKKGKTDFYSKRLESFLGSRENVLNFLNVLESQFGNGNEGQ